MDKITLYSFNSCPYAHRTRLILHEKNVDYELIEIDPQNMPDWYQDISPNGKIPLLKNGEFIVWESAIINEYLEDLYPDPALLPSEPALRARCRNWIDFADKEFLVDLHKLLFNGSKEHYHEMHKKLDIHLEHINSELLANAHPYWMGDKITLVDYAYYPFFERFPLLEYYRDFSISSSYENLLQWIVNIKKTRTVQATQNTPDYYIKEFAKWLS
jgi:glutathione S-transferase